MKFRDFNKNLSSEIENLFATIGDTRLPEDAHRLDGEEAHRLDECVDIRDLLERVKNLEPQSPDEQKNPQ